MALSGIISVSGLPGLHKVLSQTKNGLIVESLLDERRRPIYSSQKVSALEDISIYTHSEDVPLKEVFRKIADKEKGKPVLSHKDKPEALRKYLGSVVEDLDNDRVYNSDVAKLFQWYNLLAEKDLLKFDEEEGEESTENDEKKESKSKAKKPADKKSSAAKKPAAKKAATKSTAKSSAKPATGKGGGKSGTTAKSASTSRRASGRKS